MRSDLARYVSEREPNSETSRMVRRGGAEIGFGVFSELRLLLCLKQLLDCLQTEPDHGKRRPCEAGAQHYVQASGQGAEANPPLFKLPLPNCVLSVFVPLRLFVLVGLPTFGCGEFQASTAKRNIKEFSGFVFENPVRSRQASIVLFGSLYTDELLLHRCCFFPSAVERAKAEDKVNRLTNAGLNSILDLFDLPRGKDEDASKVRRKCCLLRASNLNAHHVTGEGHSLSESAELWSAPVMAWRLG
eukprot:3334210-Pyramimonas_sp.AAC.1